MTGWWRLMELRTGVGNQHAVRADRYRNGGAITVTLALIMLGRFA